MPKYGSNFTEYKLTPKTRYHLAIRITEELQKLHTAGFTHNNVNLASIVLDGDNVRLSGFDKAKSIGFRDQELLRQDVWAARHKINYRANTPKSDFVMLIKLILQDKYSIE